MFAYGFEDLTGAEWALLEALAGRAEVSVSLPYEPGRVAFASLARTATDLAALADGSLEELAPRSAEYAHPALAHLERALFDESPPPAPELDAAVRFLEGAGVRGTLELVGDELLHLIRGGTPPEQIALVAPSLETWRAPLETVLGSLGVPYAIESRPRLGSTPLGNALLQLLRYVWGDGGRRELFAYLRSPYSGLARSSVDFVEGRLRGRAIHTQSRVEEEAAKLREAPIPQLDELRAAASPTDGVRALVGRDGARGLRERRPSGGGDVALQTSRSYGSVLELLDELDALAALEGALRPDEVLGALERADVRASAGGEAGRVAVVDLLRARTRRYEVVFVLGLEEGSLPRRQRVSPFLDDDARRELGGRLERPDQVSRDRYLFYTACTRATRRLYLVREAATDDGGPREPSPFWEEVASVFDPDDVARATSRRPLSALTWPLEAAPTDRERLRGLAHLAADDPDGSRAIAESNDWGRRLARARSAFDRKTRLTNGAVLAWLGQKTAFGVTELERFADCSSAWLHERVVSPKTIDATVDAMLRGSVAHSALHKFYAGPAEGARARSRHAGERRAGGRVSPALPRRRRSRRRPPRADRAAGGRARRGALARPGGVRPRRIALAARARAAPVRGQLRLRAFGARAAARALARRRPLRDAGRSTASTSTRSARAGSSRTTSRAARRRRPSRSTTISVCRCRCTCSSSGISSASSRSAASTARSPARGSAVACCRPGAADDLPGFQRNDYVPDDDFWALVDTSRDRARGLRRPDPRGRRAARSEGGRVPVVVRSLDDVPDRAVVR